MVFNVFDMLKKHKILYLIAKEIKVLPTYNHLFIKTTQFRKY